jgi:hypothetical protein
MAIVHRTLEQIRRMKPKTDRTKINIATADPSATLSPSIDFPVEPVIRSTYMGTTKIPYLGLSAPCVDLPYVRASLVRRRFPR